jgi:hypothetical protein
MSKTLKDRPVSPREIDDNQQVIRERPTRSTFKKIQHLNPEDWEELDEAIFEKM